MDNPWQSAAAYERFMGRWSVRIAQKFLAWLSVPAGRHWLDVGCGTGSLTRLILESHHPSQITAIDSSGDFIAYAKESIANPSVDLKVSLAQSIDLETASIDAVVSGLVVNFVPEPKSAVMEMLRVAKPGGRIGIFVWDYADGMQMLRYFWDAAVALDPQVRELDEGHRFPICQPRQLETLVQAAGLKQVEATAIEVDTTFNNFDDYWQPFLGGVGPASAYVMSLDQEARQRLELKVHSLLPINTDSSISLTARAWAVKGIV